MFGKIRKMKIQEQRREQKEKEKEEIRKKQLEEQLKTEKINILQRSIDKLTDILQNMNMHDLVYILGSKKEIIRRNIMAGIARGIGSRHRVYYCNSNNNIFFTTNSKAKYTNNR